MHVEEERKARGNVCLREREERMGMAGRMGDLIFREDIVYHTIGRVVKEH